jgi:hypothetical protein
MNMVQMAQRLREIDRLTRLDPPPGSEDRAWLDQMGADLTAEYEAEVEMEKARIEAETGRPLGIPAWWSPAMCRPDDVMKLDQAA